MEKTITSYDEIKFFTSTKTLLNKKDALGDDGSLYLHGEDNKIVAIYPKNQFYYLRATFVANTELCAWLQNNYIKLTADNIKVLGNCKKKDFVEIKYDDDCFTYNLVVDDSQISVTFKPIAVDDAYYRELYNQYKNIKIYEIPYAEMNSEILEVYENDDRLNYSNGTKILEIPTDALEVLQRPIKHKATKKTTEYTYYPKYIIKYSDKDDLGRRLIILESNNEELGITITEFFVTL